MMDANIRIHHLFDEGDDIRRRDPRRSKTGRDVRRAQVGRLHGLQSTDITLEGRIEFRRGLRGGELRADLAREIGV